MQFLVLGALQAGSGGTVVELGPPKQRALLAILLMHVGEIVSVDRLVDLLWGDDPPRTAEHSIQIYVSDLRKALEPLAGRRLINTRSPGYQLDTPPETIDARQFEALVQEGTARLEAGDNQAAIKALRSALELWRGPALSDFTFEEFAQPYIRRLHDMHLDAVEELAGAELESGQGGQVVPLLEAAIREDPLRERSRELLMLALYRSGRHAEALRSYQKLRELLAEELGLEPSPPLQRLRDRVLLHDPTLLPASDGERESTIARNPYKGLQAFGEQDASDFFGRDALVERLLEAMAAGRRLIALVGPSGSGKSSVMAAGLVPRLRSGAIPGSERWLIAPLTPGPDPIREVEAATARVAGAPVAARSLTAGRKAAKAEFVVPTVPDGTRLVLVIDQFEQLFAITEESRRNQFLKALAAAVSDPASPLIVVLTLRADFYDRPLQHAEFSEVFVPGVIHVLPMTARELEAAISEPAEQVGVKVDSALVAELVAETVERPGSLPLLQYALTELFEQRSQPILTLGGYAAQGGLRGVLSRRAEAVFLGLDSDEQRTATQVFLRLVRLGRGTADSRRRVTVSDLTDLGSDPVALSSVLTAFGGHRLLTFDHDPLTGEAIVEMAHEALLTEWDRFAGWIDRYRAVLRRRDALLAAVDEWDLSGRNADYLLTGGRLDEFEAWSHEGSLQLTTRERDFLQAGLERRQGELAVDAARLEDRRGLERRARTRLIGLAAAILAIVGGVGYWLIATPPAALAPVGLLWTDDSLVGIQAEGGFDRAVTDFGLVGRKYSWGDMWAKLQADLGPGFPAGFSPDEQQATILKAQEDQLRALSRQGLGLIYVRVMWVGAFDEVAGEFPNQHYVYGDEIGHAANAAYPAVIDSQASYLAGAAAALKSRTGVIGFIGGVDDWLVIWQFEAGFEAGARSVKPDIKILASYPTGRDFGFGAENQAVFRQEALEMYHQGADIIMHAAGTAGLGAFDAAAAYSAATGKQVWVIGVDTDQYETVLQLPGATNADAWRPHILTSVLKGIDTMTYRILGEFEHGTFTPGIRWGGLGSGDSGISYSGGFLDDIRPELEKLKRQIIAGTIDVPCVPVSRTERAAELGIGLTDCHQ